MNNLLPFQTYCESPVTSWYSLPPNFYKLHFMWYITGDKIYMHNYEYT